MTITLVQNVNFGPFRTNITGSSGVGYTLIDAAGNTVNPRTTTGVYELMSGCYAANVAFPNSFNGQILWDCPQTGSLASVVAVEAHDFRISDTWVETNGLTGSIQSLLDVSYGRWKIVGNQMLFYKADNVTLVATFNLLDDAGNPTNDAVFERVKV